MPEEAARHHGMTENEVRHLQQELNNFIRVHKRLKFAPLIIDGDYGDRTKKMLHDVRFMIGYKRENLDGPPDEKFFKRARHPTRVEPAWGQSKGAVKRGKKRRRRQRLNVTRNRLEAYLKPGVGTFDGRPVAKTVIPVLSWCRKNGWHGILVSGYRSPWYSEQLCLRMCGRPSCPGRCAGRATNHAYATPQRFAIDVSDYVTFARVVAKCPLRPHIHNSLPNDRVHFSPSGN